MVALRPFSALRRYYADAHRKHLIAGPARDGFGKAAQRLEGAPAAEKDRWQRARVAQLRAQSEQALSARGAAFIPTAEGGFHATAYRDSAGHLTIGYGHEIKAGEHLADPMTQAQGGALFQSAVRGAVAEVNYGLNGYPQKQNQFDALVDLAFKAGAIGVGRGNEMMRAVHAGHARARNFLEYDMGTVNGRKPRIPGLLKRREADWIPCSKGIY